MLKAIAVAIVLMLMAVPELAFGQETDAPGRQAPSESSGVDVSKLPLNLARIQRELRKTVEREELDGKVLRYNIDVFAQTPPVVLFTPEDDLRWGPVPFSAPTHQDMLNIVTPQEFRSPVMNFGNLFDLFGRKSKNDKDTK